MHLLRRLVGSSIGRKWLMALTGLGLAGFLAVHLAGNLTIYGGNAAFNGYAESLHALGPLVWAFRAGLFTLAVVHVFFALILIVENLRARGTRYHGKKVEGGRSWGSSTMLITGPYIAVFVVAHLIHFTLNPAPDPLSTLVSQRFHDPYSAAFYVISMAIVGLHVSHGLWSAFQSLGIETLRRGVLRRFTTAASLLVAVGFGSLPLAVLLIANLLY